MKKSKYSADTKPILPHFVFLLTVWWIQKLPVSWKNLLLVYLFVGTNTIYTEVVHWIRATLEFALVRATSLCIRRTRTSLILQLSWCCYSFFCFYKCIFVFIRIIIINCEHWFFSTAQKHNELWPKSIYLWCKQDYCDVISRYGTITGVHLNS